MCRSTLGPGDLFVLLTSNSIMNLCVAPCQFKINYGNSQSNWVRVRVSVLNLHFCSDPELRAGEAGKEVDFGEGHAF